MYFVDSKAGFEMAGGLKGLWVAPDQGCPAKPKV
jgi:hypothetical protein